MLAFHSAHGTGQHVVPGATPGMRLNTWAIYVVHGDGSDMRQITDKLDQDGTPVESSFWPAWSPDGSRIAFVRGDPILGGGGWLYTAAPDGSDVRRVDVVMQTNPTALCWNPVAGT
ncbi:MAG TPA: hypothetical protein VGX27_00955 [Candidatus Dormibacteraeota bacterium]|nr:hypothetical protein [Candidatus Dormibacteraeota bacterium]